MAEGVDLYGLYNKVTDWNAVRAAGIEYAWVKLSDGNTNREDYGYVAAGKRVGIVMGGYHYAQPGDPAAQANRLIDRCSAYGALDLAPALDLEDPFVPGPAAANFAIVFLLRIQERGHVPCLYANNSMLTGILPAVRKAVPGLKVWGARYGGTLTVPHDVHQYTSTGRVPGIAGDVDRNRGPILRNKGDDNSMANFTEDDIVRLVGKGIVAQKGNDGRSALDRGIQNGWDIAAVGAKVDALAGALAAATKDPGITLESMSALLNDAVDRNLGNIEIRLGPADTAGGTQS